MNAIYHCLKDNGEKQNFMENFSNLQDKIRQKSCALVPFGKNKGNKCRLGLSINESGNLMNSIKARLLFKCNDDKSTVNYKNKINFLNKVAEITQLNIQYASRLG